MRHKETQDYLRSKRDAAELGTASELLKRQFNLVMYERLALEPEQGGPNETRPRGNGSFKTTQSILKSPRMRSSSSLGSERPRQLL